MFPMEGCLLVNPSFVYSLFFIYDAHLSSPSEGKVASMAKAQFQLNPRPGWAFVIKLKPDPLKVIGLSKFMCNTEYFLRKGEMEKWEVGNQPMFFLLSPYEDLEGITHKF